MCHDGGTMSSLNESAKFEHIAGDIRLLVCAKELAFHPDLTELVPNKLDYAGENVVCPAHTEAQRAQLVGMLQKHE